MKHRLSLLFMFVLLAACHSDILPDALLSDGDNSVSASIEQLPASKTILDFDNEILWCAGDRISVFRFRSFNDEYLLKDSSSGSASGDFTLLPGFHDDMISVIGLKNSVAFYPYVSTLKCKAMENADGYAVSGFEIPSLQSRGTSAYMTEAYPMVAVSDVSDSFSFRNICGLLKLYIKGTGSVRKLTLTGNDAESLAGKTMVFAYSDGTVPEITLTDELSSEIILECEDCVLLSQDNPELFMFTLPPVEFRKGFKVDIECSDGEVFSISTSAYANVKRSFALRMPVIDLDALADWKENEILVFEDPVVEKHFVSEFDADGDSAISVGETEAVVTVGAFFFGDDARDVRTLNDLNKFKHLVEIEDNAFNGCSVLASVSMPESLKSIGKRAFSGCSSLSDISLNDGLTHIGEESFRSCYNLIHINLPSSLKSVEEGAFKDCLNLEGFSGAGVASDGRSLIFDDVLVAYASSGQAKFSYQPPAAISGVGNAVFYNCRNMTGASFGTDVRSIGDEAFYGCGLLADVSFSEGLETIGTGAFAGCFSLKRLSTPSTLRFIGENAFGEPCGLTELHLKASDPPYVENPLFNSVPADLKIYVPDSALDEYLTSDVWRPLRAYIHSEEDDGDSSTGSSEDGAVNVLMEASVGKGINIVLMGDAFIDKDIESGSYGAYMQKAADAFFSIEPYSTYKDYFNVYTVDVVSARRGYAYGGGMLETFFGEDTHVGGNDQVVMDYALKALTEDELDDALIIVLMNREYYAGTCYMYYPGSGDYGRGLSIAYFPLGTDDEMFAQLLHHEAGGHGFAKLYDEYYYTGRIPSSEVADLTRLERFGWAKNVDLTSDPDAVKWSVFLNDSRYDGQGLGVYEGACTYRYGAYRPTWNSIMNDNTGGFNAPSREAIWYRMHKLAFGASWRYDYEDFVEYDSVNLRAGYPASMPVRNVGPCMPPLHSPVIIEKSWREIKYKK